MMIAWLSRSEVTPSGDGSVRSNTAGTPRRGRDSNDGVSVLELLVVMVILLVVIGAVSLSRGSVMRLKPSETNRLGASIDTVFVAASFLDVQSATEFTTMATPVGPTPCGTSSQLLGLLWRSSPSTNTIVSYAVTSNGVVNSAKKAIEENLVRYECTSVNGASPTVTKTTVLSYNVPASLVAEVIGQSCIRTTCNSASTSGTTGWASANGLTNISLVVREAATSAFHPASISAGAL